ncbi:snake venom serine protease serpentokallikrein-1-like, partial [Anabas testudineus]|uniref:snake venom serine protease serpentokallikrein-1-like n=1 Tax=Anabas testudineus TaxID=64144 RepID=UPI000E45A2BD
LLLLLLLLLSLGVTVSTVVHLQKRIIGGQTCGKNERQYHVKLSTDPTGTSLLCGGSLVSKQWILTAAHCKFPGNIYYLMLLKLPSPTEIKPVGLPDCKTPKIGDKVQVAGYGATGTGPNNELDIEVVDPRFLETTSYQHLFCAKTPKVDISKGNSGGGVVYKDRIYGVITFSGARTHAFVKPAVFMNIYHESYLRWITQTVGVDA